MSKWPYLLLSLFISSVIAQEQNEKLIIWNVGQGLWVTVSSQDKCSHIDIGGEKVNWKKVVKECGMKHINRSHFSHWDKDHINFAERASLQLKNFCVVALPRGPHTKQKSLTFAKFKICERPDKEVREVQFSPSIGKRAIANDYSRVFITPTTLLPGDSPIKQEKLWLQNISERNLSVLILGHHGSRTSTGDKLLLQLSHLRSAIASARYKRYGHPHKNVSSTLKKHGIALLRTEDWNTVVLEQNSEYFIQNRMEH